MGLETNSTNVGLRVASVGGGGGADLSDLAFTPIDLTDGTWTLLDPSSAIASTTIAGGVHTITLNTVAASANLAVTGTTHTWPRWYKTFEIGSTRINGADLFLWQTAVGDVAFSNAGTDAPVLIAGPSVDPTNNIANSMVAWGGQVRFINSQGGVWSINNGAVGTGTQTTHYSSNFAAAGDAILGSGINVNASNDYVSRAARQTNTSAIGTTNLFLQVGLGSQTGSNPFTSGTTVSFSLAFTAIKLRYV